MDLCALMTNVGQNVKNDLYYILCFTLRMNLTSASVPWDKRCDTHTIIHQLRDYFFNV